jgi:hypothetical protein
MMKRCEDGNACPLACLGEWWLWLALAPEKLERVWNKIDG